MHIYMTNYLTYKICKLFIQCSSHASSPQWLNSLHRMVLSTGAPVSGPENIFFKHMEKNELKELSECTFSLR